MDKYIKKFIYCLELIVGVLLAYKGCMIDDTFRFILGIALALLATLQIIGDFDA